MKIILVSLIPASWIHMSKHMELFFPLTFLLAFTVASLCWRLFQWEKIKVNDKGNLGMPLLKKGL